VQVAVRPQVQKLFKAMVTECPQVKVFWRWHIFALCLAAGALFCFWGLGLGVGFEG
jgi:hypothetical protein